MSRRGSASGSESSTSDVNFDDLDDHQVFGFLEDQEEAQLGSLVNRSKGAEFRLNFSSRISASIPPPPLPAPTAASTTPPARRNTTAARTQSPSLSAKKRKTKRPSVHSLESPTAKLFSFGTDPEEGGGSFSATSSGAPKATAAEALESNRSGTSVGTKDRRVSTHTEAGGAPNARARSKSIASTATGGAILNASASMHAETLTVVRAQMEGVRREKDHLEMELATARSTIQELEQKLAASEQSGERFAQQLEGVKEILHAKLIARDEDLAREKMAMVEAKDAEVKQHLARFAAESELWRKEIASLTKEHLELRDQNDSLREDLETQVRERNSLEAQNRVLESSKAQDREELEFLAQWKERFEHEKGEFQHLRAGLAAEIQQHEHQREKLQEQVNALLLEREDGLSLAERERQRIHHEHCAERAKLDRFVREVRGLHHLLQLSVVEAREQLGNEMKKTQITLEQVQQQASELAIQQSGREMALVSRKGRILQLETQLKNDRQTINQLEDTLAKMTRAQEKKDASRKAKFQEQKEHLEITLAVRQGLTNELHTKRKQVAELEKKVASLIHAKDAVDVKLRHSQQQVRALQRSHALDMQRFAKITPSRLSSTTASKSVKAPTATLSRDRHIEAALRPHSNPEETEWCEFLELVTAYADELQLQSVQQQQTPPATKTEEPFTTGQASRA